jgi:iron complex outermembrane recepter protein
MYVSDLNAGTNFDLPIGIVDLNLDWRGVADSSVDLGVFVKNLTEMEYYTGGASVYASTGSSGETLGDPRQFGVSLRYRFGSAAD